MSFCCFLSRVGHPFSLRRFADAFAARSDAERLSILRSLRADPELGEVLAGKVAVALSMLDEELGLEGRMAFIVATEERRRLAASWFPGFLLD